MDPDIHFQVLAVLSGIQALSSHPETCFVVCWVPVGCFGAGPLHSCLQSRLLVSSRGASKGIPLAPVSVSGMAIKRLPLLLLADSKLLLQMRSQHAGEQQQHFPVTERTNMHKHAFPLI